MRTVYTTAESAYDGFSTKCVEEGKYITDRDKPIRKVEMEERDFKWQTMRYLSGMHLAVEPDAFQELLGWFVKEL